MMVDTIETLAIISASPWTAIILSHDGQIVLLPRSCIRHPLHPAPLSRSCSRRGSCSGYAVLRGEKAPDDALARELGAMGLL